jgi:cytochrome c5
VATGRDALVATVVKGKGAMPPRAGVAALKDDEIKAAVDYMLAAAR